MGKNLLLYATDSSDLDTTCAILEHMTSLWGNAQGEVVCISPAAAKVPVQRMGDPSIKTGHEICEILTADIIIDCAIQKKASLIALHVADHRYEAIIPALLKKTPVPIVGDEGRTLNPAIDGSCGLRNGLECSFRRGAEVHYPVGNRHPRAGNYSCYQSETHRKRYAPVEGAAPEHTRTLP